MENISVSLDTDVLINWLAKETDPNTGEELWRDPYKILKKNRSGRTKGLYFYHKPYGNNFRPQTQKEVEG